jgi:tRNA (adenine22-N1)-methyltransferase
MVTDNYQHIWDTCCDHGMLGEALLVNQITKQVLPNNTSVVHFVDIVPSIMTEVTHKLQHCYRPWSDYWHCHCLDLANLPLDSYQGTHLLIISGVSGELMASLIRRLVSQYSVSKLHKIEFLLCPAHGPLALRKALVALNFSLHDEVLVEDNQRFYEVMRVSIHNKAKAISLVGEKIWQYPDISTRYRIKILNHYQRKQAGYNKSLMTERYDKELTELQETIDAYKAVNLAK